MMSRCTSLVPPPKVRISALAHHPLDRVAQRRSRGGGLEHPVLAEHLEQ
jgi:hypothetical protein